MKTPSMVSLKRTLALKGHPLFTLMNTVEDLTKEMQNLVVNTKDGAGCGCVTDDGVAEARAHLTCPVCLEMMGPPTRIWQCPQSHLVCETCRQQLENFRCPCCRTETVSIRARVAENMAKALFENQ